MVNFLSYTTPFYRHVNDATRNPALKFPSWLDKKITIGYRNLPLPPLSLLLQLLTTLPSLHYKPRPFKTVIQPSTHYLIATTAPAQKRRYDIHGVVTLVRWDGEEGDNYSSLLAASWLLFLWRLVFYMNILEGSYPPTRVNIKIIKIK